MLCQHICSKEEVEQQKSFTVEIIDRLSDYLDKQLDNAIRN
tara:strand:- start:73 stop:195 length:123 start_codon:yes stop_codon:yes gene_type:complete